MTETARSALPSLAADSESTGSRGAELDALQKSQAVIEFELDGTIRTANDNFCKALGYRLDEIAGEHHSMFVDPAYAKSPEYRRFWSELAAGKFQAGEFRRVGKGGREVWIQASYNPVCDGSGKPYKVIKLAADITAAKLQSSDWQGQLDAIGKAMAVIEFELDGTIRTANENFCAALGYRLDEIKGQHHSMFVDPGQRSSPEYRRFWSELGSGKFQSGEFRRIGKGGREIWIQASYNPILDASGRAFKVVKFASDITEAKLRAADWQGQLDAIGKSQAVIEFELDGTIRTANENFCNALGYRLDEIKGKHHSLFVDAAFRTSAEYRRMWSDLGAGKFLSGEFQRVTKDGRSIFIQATYNPILDPAGRPFKVVKFASDVTEQVLARKRNMEIVERVRQASQSLSGASNELSAVATQIAANADDSSNQVRSVAAAAEQVARNNHTVAAAIEEMSASIKSISSNTADAAKVATSAVTVSRQTNDTITKLGESSREIGQVIKTITEIAQQTNLLALNATIESARAGESGKGFAVVANEVKQLAKQSAQASEDIARRIEAIQSDTKKAVQAIGEISRIINEISAFQTSIAGAVEEQTAVTAEIGRNISEAVKAGEEIAKSIGSVAQSAESTAGGVRTARTSVEGLSKLAGDLDRLVRN